MEYTYKFPKVDVTATVIAFSHRFCSKSSRVSIVGIIRGGEPFKDKLALPGGFIEPAKETLELCAGRELYEETGLVVPARCFKSVCVQSAVDRDPRGHVIDHVYACKFQTRRELEDAHAGDDAKEIRITDFTFDMLHNTSYNYDAEGNLKGGGWMDEWAFDHARSIKQFFDTFIEW